MMFTDDTVSIISSAFTELDDTGNDEDGVEQEPNELKYVPVKTEVDELIPPDAALTEDDIDDHFLNSFNTTGLDVDTVDISVRVARVDGDDDVTDLGNPQRVRRKPEAAAAGNEVETVIWVEKPKKKKPLPPGMARRGGKRKQMSREENQARKRALKMSHLEKGHEPDVGNNTEEITLSRSGRPSRRAKLKPAIKDEPESAEEFNDDLADEDYNVDDDDEDFEIKKSKKTARKSTGGGRRHKSPRVKKPKQIKKVSDMTSEEQTQMQEKWRDQAREKRARKRVPVKTEDEGEDEQADVGEDGKVKKKKRRGRRRKDSEGSSSTSRRRSGSAARRKKIADMTEEEREAIKAKWREEARIKRARQRETMTPEQREEYLRIQREKRREQRAMAKVTMTEQEREEENRKARERKKAKRALMTPEQRKEEAQKVTLRRIERLATMTEDEKKMWRMNNYLQNMARMGRMTPEEIEKRRQQRLDYAKRRREKMTADDLERRRLRTKAYRDAMNPERRSRFLAKLRDGYRRRLERLKEDPQKWEEVKGKWKEDRLRRQKKMAEMGKNYVRKTKSETPRRRYTRKRDPNETPEQRAERIRESRRKTQKKIKLKKKLAMQKLLESGMSLDEIQSQIETPEQRERRLMRHRINRAKWNLRKRLEGVGAPPEEIEQKLSELQHTYQPSFQFRPYKPRPEAWKPIDPSDLALLEEDDEKKPDITLATTSLATTTLTPLITPKKEPRKPKASTSKTSTTTGRRGRPPKNLHLQQQQQQQQPQPQQTPTPIQQNSTAVIINRGVPGSITTAQVQFEPVTVVTMAYPPTVSSPAGASTCSYVSAAETPEPIHYTTTQQQYHQPQQYTTNQYTTTQYHFQTPTVVYTTHQQAPTQAQTYSLQHILDSITFQEAGTPGAPITVTAAAGNQITYQQVQVHHQDNSSSVADYASSYDNHSPPPSSPAGSPAGVAEDHDYSTATFGDFPFSRPPPPPSSTYSSDSASRKRGRPRKDEPPRPKKPKGSKCGHRPGPRGPKKSNKTGVIHDSVCDECGNAYNHSYLREHKLQFHNPNYKDQKCQVCGEEFKVARHWYTHYIRTHQAPAMDTKDKPHMCDSCGQSFRQKNNLEKHKYYMHGDGLKKENFKKCPVCPGEKLFKETVSLYAHLRRKHPGYNRGGHDCYRCEKTFPDEKHLSLHVQQEHPDSYFPCQYCNACRFTRFGLNFHYFRCTKISKDMRDQMRKTQGTFSLDREPLPCEFCQRKVAIFSLTRHYWEMHNVREDNFSCPECGKGFRVREFWAVHMEEKHLKTLDQMKDLVRCLNVKSREGLVIKNPDGVKGGVPGNTPSKAASQKRIELGMRSKGGRAKGQKMKKRGRKKKNINPAARTIIVTAEEEGDGEDLDDDDDEDSDFFDDDLVQTRIKGGRIRKREIIVVAEEEEKLGLLDGSSGEPAKKPGKKRGRKPGPKSKTRRKKYESEYEEDEEDEEESWRELEFDDEDEEYQPTRASNSTAGERRSSARPRSKSKRAFRESDSSAGEDDHQERMEDSPDYENERGYGEEDNDDNDDDRPETPVDEDQILEAVVKQEILSDGDDEPEEDAAAITESESKQAEAEEEN